VRRYGEKKSGEGSVWLFNRHWGREREEQVNVRTEKESIVGRERRKPLGAKRGKEEGTHPESVFV